MNENKEDTMNKKAEAFKKYLAEDENKQAAFQMEEVKEDAQHTVVFRSHVLIGAAAANFGSSR